MPGRHVHAAPPPEYIITLQKTCKSSHKGPFYLAVLLSLIAKATIRSMHTYTLTGMWYEFEVLQHTICAKPASSAFSLHSSIAVSQGAVLNMSLCGVTSSSVSECSRCLALSSLRRLLSSNCSPELPGASKLILALKLLLPTYM